PEWGNGQSVGSGVPRNVTIDVGAGYTVTLPAADRYLPGVLTITTGTLVLNPNGGELHLGDDLVWGQIPPDPCIVANCRTLTLDGNLGTDHNINIVQNGGGTLTLDHLKLVDAIVSVTGTINSGMSLIVPPGGGECLRMQGTSTLDLGGGTLQIGGA